MKICCICSMYLLLKTEDSFYPYVLFIKLFTILFLFLQTQSLLSTIHALIILYLSELQLHTLRLCSIPSCILLFHCGIIYPMMLHLPLHSLSLSTLYLHCFCNYCCVFTVHFHISLFAISASLYILRNNL